MSPTVYYSGFWSQGDGACFESEYRYSKGAAKRIANEWNDKELIRIAKELQDIQRKYFYNVCARTRHRGHYYHSGCMYIEVWHNDDGIYNYQERITEEDAETVRELLRDFANWIYKTIKAEYEYITSSECCAETIRCNEFEYRIDGSRY